MVVPKSSVRRSPSTTPHRSRRNRHHLRLIDPNDGSEILADRRVYSLKPWTLWSIELMMDDPQHPEYGASFHMVTNEEEEYALFTLRLKDSVLYPLQLSISTTNEIEYESHVPMILRTHPRKKVITISLLASVRVVPEGVAVTYREQ